jgi:hypothetical protein
MELKCKLTVQFYPQDGKIIANCPALDLCTCGTTVAEAKKRFGSLLKIFFEEVKPCDFPHVLGDLGWKKGKRQWKPPLQPVQIEKEVRIPIPV